MNQQTEILELDITQADIDLALSRTYTTDGTPTCLIRENCVASVAGERHLGVKEGSLESTGDGIHIPKRKYFYTGDQSFEDYVANFDANYRFKINHSEIKPAKFILVKKAR